VRVAFAGTPATAVPALDALAGSRHDVAVVITRPDARSGRGRTLAQSPVAERAAELGVPVLKPTSLREAGLADQLEALGLEAVAVVAYGGMVPADLLAVPSHGWVNLHFSLLPAWRGAAPVQHAIMAGDTVTGATTFRLVEELDAGPVYGTVTEQVRRGDTAGALLDRLADSGAALLVATLDGIEAGDLVAHEQSEEGVSLAPKLTSEEARVRWADPALAVDRQIRACTPAPGAWTGFGQQRLGLLPLRDPSEVVDATLEPGAVRVTRRDVWVGTGSHDVRLGDVRPAGRRPMPAADWARGVRLVDGDTLT
jgi:methionyl-tRNA formyltransferase